MSKLELEDLCKGCGFYDVCKTKNEKNILKNEIRELKELLKECGEEIDKAKNILTEDTNIDNTVVAHATLRKILTKIDNAIGEKK